MLANSFRIVPIINQIHHLSTSTVLQELLLSNSANRCFARANEEVSSLQKVASTICAFIGLWGGFLGGRGGLNL